MTILRLPSLRWRGTLQRISYLTRTMMASSLFTPRSYPRTVYHFSRSPPYPHHSSTIPPKVEMAVLQHHRSSQMARKSLCQNDDLEKETALQTHWTICLGQTSGMTKQMKMAMKR